MPASRKRAVTGCWRWGIFRSRHLTLATLALGWWRDMEAGGSLAKWTADSENLWTRAAVLPPQTVAFGGSYSLLPSMGCPQIVQQPPWRLEYPLIVLKIMFPITKVKGTGVHQTEAPGTFCSGEWLAEPVTRGSECICEPQAWAGLSPTSHAKAFFSLFGFRCHPNSYSA